MLAKSSSVAAVVLALAGCGAPSRSATSAEALPARSASPAAPSAPAGATSTPLPTASPPAICRGKLVHPSGSNSVLSPAVVDRAIASAEPPLSRALCACGVYARPAPTELHVRVTPGRGEIAATADGAALDACLAAHLGGGLFAPWPIESDCVDCGPKRYGVFHGSPPVDVPKVGGSLVFPARAEPGIASD